MSENSVGDVTVLLRTVNDQTPGAADRLMSIVYEELRKIARNRTGATGFGTLETTALVHEAYLRLFGKLGRTFENRHHFFWAAARAMRDILVERARNQGAVKRGGRAVRVELDDDCAIKADTEAGDLLTLNDALARLEVAHPSAAKVVMLRFFAGLTRDETAEQLAISPAAVWREWSFAKAWLHAEMTG